MPESHLLIRLETSFKNWQKAQNVNIYSILKAYIWFYSLPPPIVYGLYTCENVNNYGWPLSPLNLFIKSLFVTISVLRHFVRMFDYKITYRFFWHIGLYSCLEPVNEWNVMWYIPWAESSRKFVMFTPGQQTCKWIA